jgi:NAD(P)H-dependent flavin oxidoreductase YrpB (nitropropane dioxygenase family)
VSGVLETSFTRLLGLRAPLQLAALPFHGTSDLAAAFADAGGLGMVGLPLDGPEAVASRLDELRARTKGAIGIGFLMPFLERECVAAAASRARVVEFFYGEPDAGLVELGHAGGALVSWQVGSPEEARAAEGAGCDFLIAQGTEAGGHVRGRSGLLPLLAEVLEAVSCPVLAAGGIAGPRELAAVLAAGAAGARLGTRMLAASEANVHPRYRALLFAARAGDTVLTDAFSVGWPDAPHRVLRSALVAAQALRDPVAGSLPTAGGPVPIPRFGVLSPTRETSGSVEAMSLYAGEGVGALRHLEPAADIVRNIAAGAETLLKAPR